MLLLILEKGEKKVLEKYWVHANHSYLPLCLLSGGNYVPTEHTGNATNALPHALPISPGVTFQTQATSSFVVGRSGVNTKYHMKQKPRTTAGEKDQTHYMFACNKYLPTGRAALSESFSTLRERVATSLGAVRRGWYGHAQKQGSTPRSPWRIFSLSTFF